MVNQELARAVVNFMNELTALDPVAIALLLEHRVPCNAALSDHPTCQVGPVEGKEGDYVGMLGVLNGLCGVWDDPPLKGWGAVAAVMKSGEPGAPLDRFMFLENKPFAEQDTAARSPDR